MRPKDPKRMNELESENEQILDEKNQMLAALRQHMGVHGGE
jgi:hypothetical protein